MYENAISKINEVLDSDSVMEAKQEVKELVKNTKTDIEEFFEKEEVKTIVDKAKTKTVNLADKALNTLKEWLKPEDK